MKILKDEKIIDEAIQVLSDGGVVLYPTDTVYGLGANIFNNDAVRRVFEIKKRSFLKPLSILVSDIEAIDIVARVTVREKEIINEYLPSIFLALILSF